MTTLLVSLGITLMALSLASAASLQPGEKPPAAAGPAGAPPPIEEVIAQLPLPGSGEVFVRTIPADVLRDFAGRCFSYNNREFFKVNETWNINGVCAMAECMALPIDEQGHLGLFEQVFDCGPSVVESVKECSYTRNLNLSMQFPDCCPKFTCEEAFDARSLLLPAGPPTEAAAGDNAPAASAPAAVAASRAAVAPAQ